MKHFSLLISNHFENLQIRYTLVMNQNISLLSHMEPNQNDSQALFKSLITLWFQSNIKDYISIYLICMISRSFPNTELLLQFSKIGRQVRTWSHQL